MSLHAFTNEPGTHTKSDGVSGYQRGKYYGSDNLNELVYFDPFTSDIAAKWYPTPGYGLCTDWSRYVRKVIANEPARWRRHETVGNPPDEVVIIELNGDHHITIDYDLGSYVVPNPGDDNAKSESVTKALNKLTEKYVGIGNDLGEARQTCDSFAHLALRAGGFLNAVKHLRFRLALENLLGYSGKRGTKSLPKTIADLWLEYSYGWKPLAADLYEAQQLAHKALEKPVPIKATATGHSENQIAFVFDNRLDVKGAVRSSHRTVLHAHVSNPWLANLSQAGLINPVSIAWELVPFSFVVDWFVPIGATLQAITAGVGLESDGGYTSSQTHDALEIKYVTNPGHTGNGFWYDEAGDYRDIGFSFHRQCYTSFPAPQLYADVTPYSTTRALNALALIKQLT
ncbi:TPA_asm: maturation protein [ssRNA phage Gerhypos.3_19]|uniref:Maturation protein n=2 Tax=Fiersviridae TaxID=2842319 RepID=A0A8S5KXA5_9VIRU|nr:maturation protein [ssRNA phage Gerhypos.3_19]QDH90848.1 MAG: hypothetical protein H3Bulk42279_000002 [Leviviridae sp.]DAD50110.1 TPA_asm: maturation protein [ssRNA phage Gerhypos.3_19]